jgi:hypothetical protein
MSKYLYYQCVEWTRVEFEDHNIAHMFLLREVTEIVVYVVQQTTVLCHYKKLTNLAVIDS